MNATLTPPVKPCFFSAKPLTFRSRLHGLFSPGFMVAPISARKLAPLVSAPRMATPSAFAVFNPITLLLRRPEKNMGEPFSYRLRP